MISESEMPSRKADDPLIVQVPSAAQDRPSWRAVAIIAALGFLGGIVWPRLAGVRLGPSLPEVPSTASASSTPVAASSAASTPGVASGPAPSRAVSAAPVATPSAAPSTHASERPPVVTSVTPTHTSERASTSADAAPVARASGGSTDGTAQVVWETALIRDAPKSGKIIARLPRGTTIRIGPVKDGWYPVKPGDGFAGEGWVFRGALGR